MELYQEAIPLTPTMTSIPSNEELEYPVSKVFLNRNLKKTQKLQT